MIVEAKKEEETAPPTTPSLWTGLDASFSNFGSSPKKKNPSNTLGVVCVFLRENNFFNASLLTTGFYLSCLFLFSVLELFCILDTREKQKEKLVWTGLDWRRVVRSLWNASIVSHKKREATFFFQYFSSEAEGERRRMVCGVCERRRNTNYNLATSFWFWASYLPPLFFPPSLCAEDASFWPPHSIFSRFVVAAFLSDAFGILARWYRRAWYVF